MEPKIRFRDEHGKNYSGWTTQKMSEIGSFFRGRILSKADLSESGTPCILYGELYTTYDEITTDIFRKTNRSLDGIYVTTGGEVIVPCSGETPEDISTATCVVPAGVALGSDLIIFKGNGAVLGPVMSYIINHKQKWNIAKKAQGKSVVHITTDTLKNLNITFPSLAEQQKIADFLSTYDKKIQLQRGRVESLERRKKGLLQKVFSQEIRFKADDGSEYPEWGKKKIEEICSHFKSGKYISASDILPMGIYPVYGGNGIRGYANHFNHNGDYIVIGRQGALCGNVRRITGLNYCTEHAIAVQANSDNCTFFLEYLFTVMRLGQYSDQGAQPGLAVNKLVKLETEVPCLKEQEKIAAFFTVIDDQINIEKERLTTMETIKKGLLQGLFC